jgi:pSer/pThr/pTyr-binding forkhead associated (FHA) protein
LSRPSAGLEPTAYLVYRDEHAVRRSFVLAVHAEPVRIGRGPLADLRLAWDREVSRIHAELVRVGRGWGLVDDGLSSNGTYVNGERLSGRQRLAGGDEIRVGRTSLVFQLITDDGSKTYVPAIDWPPVELSRMQRLTLVALCRPILAEAPHGSPATNQEIAEELFISLSAVKTHLRALFVKFGIADVPQNQKRARLATLALERGLVTRRDLDD